VEFGQKIEDLATSLRIQTAGGLIGQQDRRPDSQRRLMAALTFLAAQLLGK